ncbi:MAG: hypothetical protein ACFB20_09865 [Opitutales bacterium]
MSEHPEEPKTPSRGTFRIPTIWVIMAVVTYAVLHTLYVLSVD